MSSKSNQKLKASLQHTPYQSIPQTVDKDMDNPAMTRSTDSADGSLDRTGAGTLRATYSSQQLMPPSDSDSVEDGERLAGGVTPTVNLDPARRVTGSQWFTMIVLCFVNLINYMDRFTIAGVLEDIQHDFGIGDDKAGLLQTVFIISYMICAPIFGYLGDRYSRRWIMAVGVTMWCTTTLLGSFMNHFGWFIAFRAMVGIGEASYSTIAPTIISDLFVHDMRSKMLAMFYFAIPVGSGFGYIVGAETAHLANNWRWALRVTPFLGVLAVVLILLTRDPERGESEGSHNLAATTYKEDIKYLAKNKSFTLTTAAFTCIAFVAGALSWWAPKFIFLGLKMNPINEDLTQNEVSYKFGMITMLAGLIGVPMGAFMAQRLRPHFENCDPYICAAGLLLSAPMVYMCLVLPQTSGALCFLFIFVAQVGLNLCWSIVADILLYVVIPTRRSTAEAMQILIAHTFGDAGSPYFVGLMSEAIKTHLNTKQNSNLISNSLQSLSLTLSNVASSAITADSSAATLTPLAVGLSKEVEINSFIALQYSLFTTCFVEVLGGIFFLVTTAFIIKDKNMALQAVRETQLPNSTVNINEIS